MRVLLLQLIAGYAQLMADVLSGGEELGCQGGGAIVDLIEIVSRAVVCGA